MFPWNTTFLRFFFFLQREALETGGRVMESEVEEKGGGEEVMSEVHLGCPPDFTGPYISLFTVSFSGNLIHHLFLLLLHHSSIILTLL